MKRSLKIFFVIIALFLIKNVSAYKEITEGMEFSYSGSTDIGGLYALKTDTVTSVAVCVDPGKILKTDETFTVERYLTHSDNEQTNSIDYGMLTIIKYCTDNKCTKTQLRDAMRLYYCRYLGLCRFANNTSGNAAKKRYGIDGSSYSEDITDKAVNAYNAAITAKKSYDANLNKINVSLTKKFAKNDNGKRYIFLELNIKGFTQADSVLNFLSISSKKVIESIKASNTYSTNVDDYTENFSFNNNSTNYATKSSNDKFTKYILITLDENANNSNLTGGIFTVKYQYYDDFFTSGMFMEPNVDDISDYQEFVQTDISTNFDTIYKFMFVASVEVKDDKDACKPTFTMPAVCSDDNNTVTEEGYVTYEYKEGIDSKGNENPDLCIYDNTDTQGNNYLRKKVNEFCSIYCKEDYTFEMPYKINSVNPGRYFQLNANITEKQSCYMKIDTTKYDSEIAVLNTIDGTGTTDASNKKASLTTKLNDCYNYTFTDTDKCEFNPTVKYYYNEPIEEKLAKNKYVKAGENDEMVCSTTSGEYTKYFCDSTFNNCVESNGSNKTNYVKWVSESTAKCTTPRVFYTMHQTGKIISSTSEVQNADLIDGLPVASNTPSGMYYYKITLEDIGYYENSCKDKGRVLGNENSVVQNDDKITITDSNNTETTVMANEYACTYNVSGACKKCEILCRNCITTSDMYKDRIVYVNFEIRTISEGNINPNNRTLGYNWNIDNPLNALVALKAKNTINEIQSRANSSVTTDEDTSTSDNDYTFKITLTPSMIQDIREYNDNHEEDGGYSDNSLTCNDYKLSDITEKSACTEKGYAWKKESNGNYSCVAQNIMCYSDFIDELIEKYSDSIDNEIVTKRNAAKNNQSFKTYSSISELDESTNIVTNDYWTIYIYDTLDINSDGIPDIGPSWK